MMAMKPIKYEYWYKTSAEEYAAQFPAKPEGLRKIAYGLRRLGARGAPCPKCGQPSGDGSGNEVFTMCQAELAKECDVSLKTLQRYTGTFESYGILEVKRWRYRVRGGSPSSYRVFLGKVIPEGGHLVAGPYPIPAVERRKKTP
jgi:hypothetical protein